MSETNQRTLVTRSPYQPAHCQAVEADPMFDVRHPYMLCLRFIAAGAPEEHEIRINHDGRAYTGSAEHGHYEIEIYDVDDPIMYIASAGFVRSGGYALCDRLSVDDPHRGMGLGRAMLELGSRLYGQPIWQSDDFTDADEAFWASPDLN